MEESVTDLSSGSSFNLVILIVVIVAIVLITLFIYSQRFKIKEKIAEIVNKRK